MIDVKSKRGAFSTGDARSDDALQQSAVKEIFGQLADFGPQVLTLQKGLLGGLVRSQEREARRLTEADETDTMVAAARDRTRLLTGLLAEVGKIADAVDRVAQGERAGNMFHGYVLDSEGEPAVGYTVQVLRDGVERRALKGMTDDAGYFQIRFDKPETRNAQRANLDVAAMRAETFARRQQPGKDANKPSAAAATPEAAAGAPASEAPTVEVDILDASGKNVVFRDPSPPSFISGDTVFRYYPLLDV